MQTRRLVIDDRGAGSRLDVFLAGQQGLAGASGVRLSRSEIQRLISEGQITVNGVRVKASVRVRSCDCIGIALLPPREPNIRGEAMPLDVLHEDSDCIVVNKAAGMTVHPSPGHSSGTLVNALLHYCPDIGSIGGEHRPGIVHRLDKDTSGVMVVAKNGFAYQKLVKQFKDRVVEKRYVALVWGKIAAEKGVIDRAIGRHRTDRKKMSSAYTGSRSRQAVTEWNVRERFVLNFNRGGVRQLTLLELQPRTGRTHQIRVHLADMGFPLVGDPLYGRKDQSGVKRCQESVLGAFSRQALHAEKLSFRDVRTDLRVEFTAPLAEDMAQVLQHLRLEGRPG